MGEHSAALMRGRLVWRARPARDPRRAVVLTNVLLTRPARYTTVCVCLCLCVCVRARICLCVYAPFLLSFPVGSFYSFSLRSPFVRGHVLVSVVASACAPLAMLHALCAFSLPGEVKYCVAKLFSNDVKFAKITDY